MKAEFKAENGTVSVDNNKSVVSLTLGGHEFKMITFEAKELQKILKIVV